MSLLPDPAQLRALADRVAGHALATRERAHRLSVAVAGARWQGRAAEAFDAEALVVVAALRRAAGRLDDAADTLRRHARRVQTMIDDVTALGRDGAATLEDLAAHPGRLLSDGEHLVADGAGLVGDALGLIGIG